MEMGRDNAGGGGGGEETTETDSKLALKNSFKLVNPSSTHSNCSEKIRILKMFNLK